MPSLISTVISYMSKDVYGLAGEQVIIVADYNNVVIVELNGNKFPTSKDNLTNEKREVEPAPVEVKEPGKRQIKKVKTASPQLF